MSEIEFEEYEGEHVIIGSERATMFYNVVVVEYFNLDTVDEDAHTFDSTQEEDDDVFFNQDPLVDTREYLNMTWKGLEWSGNA